MTALAPLAVVDAGAVRPVRVRPFCVFAAGRQQFTALVYGDTTAQGAKTIFFLDLPLTENGWDFGGTRIKHIGAHPEGKIYQLTRQVEHRLTPDIAETGFQTGLRAAQTINGTLDPHSFGGVRC